MTIDAITGDDAAAALSDAAGAIASELGLVIGKQHADTGRLRLQLSHSDTEAKDSVYAECVSNLLTDLLVAIDTGRRPRVDIVAATSAVTLAIAATPRRREQQHGGGVGSLTLASRAIAGDQPTE